MGSATKLSLNQIAVLSALMVEARELTNAELTELAGASLTGEERKRLVSRGLVQERRVGRSYSFELSAAGWTTGLSVLAAQPRGKGAAASAVGTLLTGLSRALTARGDDARSFFADGTNPADGTNSAVGTTSAGDPKSAVGTNSVDGTNSPGGTNAPAGTTVADGTTIEGAMSDGQRTTGPMPTSSVPRPPAAEPPSPAEVDDRIRIAYAKLATEPAGWVSLADLRGLLGDVPRPDVDGALKRIAVQSGVRLIPIANLKSLSAQDREAAVRFGGEDNHAIAIEAS